MTHIPANLKTYKSVYHETHFPAHLPILEQFTLKHTYQLTYLFQTNKPAIHDAHLLANLPILKPP